MAVDPDRPPRLGMGLLRRAALAGLLIVLATASAVSATVMLEIEDIRCEFVGCDEGRQPIDIPEITKPEGGPRTIMLLGSDKRYGEKGRARSDTIVLLRVNPNRDAIALLSIPRDLKVEIPGYAYKDKVNAAYTNGGERLTVRTVKRLFAHAGAKHFAINNVINVNFAGFRRAINFIGGVYVDVDRRYYNDNAPPTASDQPYATIDVEPGYRKLKGQDALDYVRYRHTDNDFMRAARQQDFLRQAKAQSGFRKLLDFSKRHDLAKAFGRYFQVDDSLNSVKEILSLLKLGIFTAQKVEQVQQVKFRSSEAGDYVVASDTQLRRTLDEFMHARATTAKPSKRRSKRGRRRARRRTPLADVAGLETARTDGENQAILAANKLGFPFYFPIRRLQASSYDAPEPHIYTIRDEKGKKHRAYRLVLRKPGELAEYYGVQGMNWRAPPILDDPSETREIAGRRLRLYYDGRDLRVVAWRTPRAVYWVSNTLTQSLSERQMLSIAASLRRVR